MHLRELEAWLGDARSDLTDQQVEALLSAAADIEVRYPEEADADKRDGALQAAHYLMVNGSSIVVDVLANRLRKAREAETKALAGLQQAALTVIRPDGRDVESEHGFAKFSGIDRMTVRKWLGKR